MKWQFPESPDLKILARLLNNTLCFLKDLVDSIDGR